VAIMLSISHKAVNRLIRLCDKQNESIKHNAGTPRVLPTHFCWGLPILDDIWVPLRRPRDIVPYLNRQYFCSARFIYLTQGSKSPHFKLLILSISYRKIHIIRLP
jgi:hypothetical protein